MRGFGAGLVAMAMTLSSAFAAESVSQGPLAPGKPAGVRRADIEAGGVWLVLGIVAVAGVIAAVASTTQGNSTTSPSGTA
ncbi:MAG TPA: hypothetical protein VFI23_14970 [Rhizomicrobium sp.]|nr:hypothetical protein [Rhizomicrobium sp.]